MRTTLSVRLRAGLIAFALVLSQVLLPVQSAYATKPADPPEDKKVYVCKYVGKPGVDEVLQTGQNPIEVSVNATGGAAVGSYFADAQGRSFVLGAVPMDPAPNVTDCPAPEGPKEIPLPMPESMDPCGPDNAYWIVPEDTDQYEWKLKNNGELIVKTTEGYVFPGDETRHNYGKALDSGKECDKEIEVPAMPNPNDPCGLNNASWVLPEDGDNVTWAIVGGELIATADDGYVFVGGSKTKNFGMAQDSGELCEVPVPTPQVTDECNIDGDNAMWIVPEDTTEVRWKLRANGKLVAIANEDYVFANGKTRINFGLPQDSGVMCVTPEEPTKMDVCGVENDTFTIPESDSVQYVVNGNYLPAGTYPANGQKVYIKAYALKGYEVQGQYKWKLVFTNKYCDPFTPEIYKTNQNGDLLAGAVFDIEVCQMVREKNYEMVRLSLVLDEQDNCVTYYDVDLGLDGKWFENNVEYKEYVPTTVTITETKAPGTCVAGGPWTFVWSYPPKEEGEYNDEMSLMQRSYMNHYGKVGAWENGSNVWYLENTCPTGGSGGVTPDPEVPAKTVSEVVQELPHTGPGGTITTIIALLAAMVTYGAVYFAQPKRQFED